LIATSTLGFHMDFDALEANNYKSFPLCLAWLIPYALLATVAFHWPADEPCLGMDFRGSAWVLAIPSISGYVSKSPFPAAVAAYFVLSAVLFFPTFLVALLSPSFLFGSASNTARYVERFRRWHPVIPCLIVALISVGAVVVFWIQPGYQFGLLPLYEERWALALGGPLFGFYSALFLFVSCTVHTVRLWLMVVERMRDGME
jgi:hypothetical protein